MLKPSKASLAYLHPHTHLGPHDYRYYEPPVDYSEDSSEYSDNEQQACNIMQPHHTHHQQRTAKTPLPMKHIDFCELTLERLIGQGGFGKVYKGKYVGKDVAIKEPLAHSHVSSTQSVSIELLNAEIIKEANLHNQLNHPNIIKMFGISLNERKVYLVMEYARGNSLRELLTKTTLSPDVIIRFSMQISGAMEYLHNLPKAIIHRDLKSPNSKLFCV